MKMRWHSFDGAVPVSRQKRDVEVQRMIAGMEETGRDRDFWQTGDTTLIVWRDQEGYYQATDAQTRRTGYSL